MPKQMSFDSFGINFPESYWELAHINISLIDKQGSITFFGYANKKARENGDRMIANKTYRVTPQILSLSQNHNLGLIPFSELLPILESPCLDGYVL